MHRTLIIVSLSLRIVACATPGGRAEREALPDADPAPTGEPAAERFGELYYQLMVAEFAVGAEDYAEALRAYLEALDLTDDPRVAERAARLALHQQANADGERAARRWLALAPDAAEARQVLAMFQLRRGEQAAALENLRRFLRESESAEDALARVGVLLTQEPDREAALALMRELVAENPGLAQAHYVLAQVASHFGETELAIDEVQRALLLEPDWRAPRLFMIRLHLQDGRTEEALSLLERVLEGRPEDHELRLYYARALLDMDRLESALEQFELLLQERPRDAQVLYGAALLALELERFEEARAHLLELVNLGQRLDEAYYYLGRLAEEEQDAKGALRWYNEVDGERRVEAQLRMALISADKGNPDAARSRLAALRAAFPDEAVRSYIVESDLLRRAGRGQAAVELLDEALGAHPDETDLLYARALMQVELGRLEAAERDLRRLLEQQPEHSHALNALGFTLVDRTERHREGFELIRRAYRLNPDNPAIIDSMGWAHYRLGELEPAREYLEKAYQLSAEPEIAAHLAEVLWQLGEREEAERVLAAALEQHPDDAILNQTRKRLRP